MSTLIISHHDQISSKTIKQIIIILLLQIRSTKSNILGLFKANVVIVPYCKLHILTVILNDSKKEALDQSPDWMKPIKQALDPDLTTLKVTLDLFQSIVFYTC